MFKKQDKGFDVTVAMDSAFLHARCLFKFFCEKESDDFSIRKFGLPLYQSTLWDSWKNRLKRHVMHISKGRLNPSNIYDDQHLNEQVEIFAREILKIWKQSENDLPLFAESVKIARKKSIIDAENDTKRLIKPFFSY